MRVLFLLPLALLTACGGAKEDSTAQDDSGATAPAAATATAALSGEQIFARCSACHKVDASGTHGAGPNLAGVVGSKMASKAGYAYSDGLKAKGGVWDEASLSAYLEDPRTFVPGTKMVIALKNPEERKALIDWLKTK